MVLNGIPICLRCPSGNRVALMTTATGADMDGRDVAVSVHLCYSCRQKAALENQQALHRGAGRSAR